MTADPTERLAAHSVSQNAPKPERYGLIGNMMMMKTRTPSIGYNYVQSRRGALYTFQLQQRKATPAVSPRSAYIAFQ
jgi:hypothetical protein